MDASTVDKQVAALRADDSIERALAEMNSRLATWAAAMTAGQTALLSGASQAAASARGNSASGSAPVVGAQEAQHRAPRRGAKLFKGQVPKIAARHGRQTPAALTAPATGQPEAGQDDEKLLATLDVETARAVRVKRRLTNKSVRELLEEARLERSQ